MYTGTAGLATDCPAGHLGCGGTDIEQPSQSFQNDTIVATANLGQNVWNDLQPPFAGLGVGILATQGSDADQIVGTDVLTLTFQNTVQILGIATLFAHDHSPFGGFDDTQITNTQSFLVSVDGGAAQTVLFSTANSALLLVANLTGHIFAFQQNGADNPGFYVSALSFVTGQSVEPNSNPRCGLAVWWWRWLDCNVRWTTQTEAEVRLGNYD